MINFHEFNLLKRQMNKKIKISIIGGSSFIGQNLIKYLTNKNSYIITATYTKNNEVKKKFKKLEWKKVDFKKNKKNYFKYLNSPDILINCAWPDIPNYKSKNHFKTFYHQKKLSYNLINNGLKNLIILGTCYEYGKKNGCLKESDQTFPLVPYAIAKKKLLQSILLLKKKKNFKFTWLRPFFVFGNNKKRKTLFSILKNNKTDEFSKLSLNGSLKRDFVSVKFLNQVILKIFKLDIDIGILNVCTGRGITIKSFISKHLRNKKNIKFIDMNGKNSNEFEPKSFWGDNTKLKKIIFNEN